MNLTERTEAMLAQVDEGSMLCAYGMANSDGPCVCMGVECASYLPEEKECARVLAARAQLRAAKALESISNVLSIHIAGIAGMLADATGVDVDSGDSYVRIRGCVGTKDLDRI